MFHIYPCVSCSLLYDLRSCYRDSVIIFKLPLLPLLSFMRAVSLHVNVPLTYRWYLLQVQKYSTCCVHSVLMHCNSNVCTQYHGTRVGTPEGPPCHAYGNVDRNRVSWKSGLLWLMITRAFLLVLSLLAWQSMLLITETSWSMGSILPCLVSDHVLYGQDHYCIVLVVTLPT